MKRVVSFLLGAVFAAGIMAMGVQSSSANVPNRQNETIGKESTTIDITGITVTTGGTAEARINAK